MSEQLAATIVAAHRAVFDGVLEAVDDLDELGWSTPTGCPGWDVRDQLSHLVGIERAMLGDPPDDVELPAGLDHVVTDFDRATELAVEARRRLSAQARLDEARDTFARRLAMLEALDPATLREPLDGPAGMRMKASQMLRTRVFDLTCHEQDIRRALGRPGGLQGPHVDIAVEQVLRAWAKVLPGRLGDGVVLDVEVVGYTRVLLDLAQAALHRLDPDAQPPGMVPPDAGSPAAIAAPTAAIRLDAGQLLAVGTGRRDAPEAASLHRSGDPAVVDQWVRLGSVTP